MTRTMFLITSIAVTALAVAVPAALGSGIRVDPYEHGQGRSLDSPKPLDAVAYFYANERATIPFPPTIHDHGDATQAKLSALGNDRPAASYYNPQVLQRMSDSWAARGGVLTNVPASSYYLPQQIEAMSQSWAARGGLLSGTTALEVIRDHGDATQAKLVAQRTALEVVRDHGDATQAKLTRLSGPVVTPEILRDHGSAEQAKLDAQSSGTTSVESASGSELDWSQLTIGFGVGMLLVLGLVAGVQFARNERLAH